MARRAVVWAPPPRVRATHPRGLRSAHAPLAPRQRGATQGELVRPTRCSPSSPLCLLLLSILCGLPCEQVSSQSQEVTRSTLSSMGVQVELPPFSCTVAQAQDATRGMLDFSTLAFIRGGLHENNVERLVGDIEALRSHLGFDRWEVVLGGSWGVTLALAYAARHPSRVGSLVLRAVCLMRRREISWLFGSSGGARRLLPERWDAFSSTSGVVDDRASESGDGDDLQVLKWYANAMAGNGPTGQAAASAWFAWEMSIFGLSSRLPAFDQRGRTWTWRPTAGHWTNEHGAILSAAQVEHSLVHGFEGRVATALAANGFPSAKAAVQRAASAAGAAASAVATSAGSAAERASASAAVSLANGKRSLGIPTEQTTVQSVQNAPAPASASAQGSPTAAPQSAADKKPSTVSAQAVLTSHYSVSHAARPEDELLSCAPTLRGIPCIAVQGGNDLICPPVTAFELHTAWPEMELRIVHGAGHSMYDLQAEIIRATDAFRDVARAARMAAEYSAPK